MMLMYHHKAWGKIDSRRFSGPSAAGSEKLPITTESLEIIEEGRDKIYAYWLKIVKPFWKSGFQVCEREESEV